MRASTLRSRGRTLAAIVAVSVAVFGFELLLTRPWTLSAQLPALVLVLVGACLYAASRRTGLARAKIVVVCLSVLIGLYGVEFYLAMEVPRLIERVINPDYDGRDKREVVVDLRSHGDTAAAPITYPSLLISFPGSIPNQVRADMANRLLPLGGLPNRTTVLCNESGKWATYRADEHGFRNPVGAWRVPPRVAVVGDSFSHGNCVDDGEDWVGVVRRSVPQTLNLGIGGNGPLLMLATIREYLREYKPPIVIWQYFDGHDARITGELGLPILQRYLQEPSYSQGLIGRQDEINVMLETVIDKALREPPPAAYRLLLDLKDVLRLNSLRGAVSPRTKAPDLAVLARVLREAKNTVEGWGGKMYFVYLPAFSDLRPGPAPSDHASHDQVLGMAKDWDLDVVDLQPVFRSHPDPLSLFPFRRPYHYNAAGYALVADAVLKRIAANVGTEDVDEVPKRSDGDRSQGCGRVPGI